MSIKLDQHEEVVLSSILHNVKQVTELRILTPIDQPNALEVTPTLANLDYTNRSVVATAPLPIRRFEGDALKAVLADAYTRAKAYEAQGVQAQDQCLYGGIRDAIYAALEATGGWSPKVNT